MCAIQTDPDVSSIDSWYIFQYGDRNIKHGDSQMKGNGRLQIGELYSIGCSGGRYTIVARFNF